MQKYTFEREVEVVDGGGASRFSDALASLSHSATSLDERDVERIYLGIKVFYA